MPNATAAQTITAVIAEAMREQSVSQRRVAERLGITQSQVSARLRGEVDWRSRELEALSELLDVTLTIGGAA